MTVKGWLKSNQILAINEMKTGSVKIISERHTNKTEFQRV